MTEAEDEDENLKNLRNTCVPIALARVSGLPYRTIHAVCAKHGWTERGMKDSDQFQAMQELGIRLKKNFNHHLIGATLRQFLSVINPNKTFLVDLRGHLTVVQNGKLIDDTNPGLRSRVRMYRQVVYPDEPIEPDTVVQTTRDMFRSRR